MHPREEFTWLQCLPAPTRAEQKQAAALLKAHWADWLGPLAPILVRSETVFARGVLTRCAVKALAERRYPPAVGDARWSTVTHLTGPAVFYEHPVMSALTWLSTTEHLRSTDLCTRATPYGLTSLACYLRSDDDVRLLGHAASLPALTALRVPLLTPKRFAALAATPLFPRLSRLALSSHRHQQDLAGWQARAEAVGLSALRVSVVDYQGGRKRVDYDLQRGTDDRLSVLTVTFSRLTRRDGWAAEILQHIAEALRSLPPTALSALTIDGLDRLPSRHFGPEHTAVIRAAAGRFVGVVPQGV